MSDELAFTPAWQIRDLVQSKEVSPKELVDNFLRRIDSLDTKLNSYITVTADLAQEAATKAEEAVVRGDQLGPLHGIPISIKDLEFSKDIRSTMGSYIFRDHIPSEDSIVVERVKQAGAIILGKTNTPEFGQSATTENRLTGPCRNPWDLERTSGGSSGGAAAALAAGLCSLATGTDGGGSIRIPASFCGVYGIKPTQLRVPRYGSVGRGTPPANLFSQPGPISRTVKDSAILLQVLSGHDPRDPMSLKDEVPDFISPLNGRVHQLRIGWTPDYGYAPVNPGVLELSYKAAKCFEEFGCTVEEVDLGLDNPFKSFWTMFSSTAYSSYGHLLNSDKDDLTSYGRYSLEQGKASGASDYARALNITQMVKRRFTEIFEKYDLIMSPTMPIVAFPIGQEPQKIAERNIPPHLGYIPLTFPINMSGQTAASIPCGFSDGMPVGLHIIGKALDESTVLQASAAYEQAYPWIDKIPSIA